MFLISNKYSTLKTSIRVFKSLICSKPIHQLFQINVRVIILFSLKCTGNQTTGKDHLEMLGIHLHVTQSLA